ncbi:IkappaB kinase complex, IKAP component [Clavulina sp. PMI_390]|nr:IkappaB kinase complex, IKAP component [Clavulina sp. PMI_390]
MRNISLSALSVCSVDESIGLSQSFCYDLDNDVVYGASVTAKSPPSIVIWKEDTLSRKASQVAEIHPETSPSSASVLCLHVLPETHQLCVIFEGGDIAVISLDDVEPTAEFVGAFDSGILAASWSPDEAYLVLINGDNQLLQMSRDFDVLYEAPLATTEFGEDKQNSLGWGSKATQFHGSLGKSAAAAPANPTLVASTPSDDKRPRISWRGDGTFFAVSSLEASESPTLMRRVVRVYSPSPEVTLHSTIEPTPGLEHQLAWNPSGSLIASTQLFGTSSEGLGAGREGRHDVVFYERNGLRRHSFEIVKGGNVSPSEIDAYAILDLAWSCDSSILAVWLRTEMEDIIQLWATGNYHWYLKQSIPSPTGKKFTSILWHPEKAMRLALSTSDSVTQIDLAWSTCSSPSQPPTDTGTVVVVDGVNGLVTPFRVQNIPPPMCSITLPLAAKKPLHDRRLPSAPVDVALAPHRDLLAALLPDRTISVWDLSDSTSSLAQIKKAPPRILWESTSVDSLGTLRDQYSSPRQIVIWEDKEASDKDKDWKIAVLASKSSGSADVLVLYSPALSEVFTMALETVNARLFVSDGLWVEGRDGTIMRWDSELQTLVPTETTLTSFCFDITTIPGPFKDVTPKFVGLNPQGKLFLSTASETAMPKVLAENVISYAAVPSYLTYTTTAHEAHFTPISTLLDESHTPESIKAASETRRVERGSRIVVAVPSNMSLVLQMPRGNLETISPRPFVLEVVRDDVINQRYRKAFLACRKHRVDLNYLLDCGFEAFLTGLGEFIEQVPEVDHINLLLANIGRSSRPASEINQICDEVRTKLLQRDLKTYVNSILTSYAVRSPPDLEAALRLLAQLQTGSPDLVEDALKYTIFLADANVLFDTALGMYDFPLTLLVAQHSQRDPREYLPFLRELRALPDAYQRFAIDDHLKRYSKALVGLRESGDAKFDEAIQYVEKHRLYVDALQVWKAEAEKHLRLLEAYGDYLYERRDFEQAGLGGTILALPGTMSLTIIIAAFGLAKKWRKAMLSYERAHMWKEAFALLVQAELADEEISSMAIRVAEDLTGRKRHIEAARVLFDYGKDVSGGITSLVQGNDVSEALRVITLQGQTALIEQIVWPGVLELCEELVDEIREAGEQLSKQSSRYRELQTRKAQEPELFYMENNVALQDVDTMTDAGESVVSTAFTRYTRAPSASSKVSKSQTNKSKKTERKKGKKGTVDEEAYIIASFVKMVPRLEHLKVECSKLLPHLLNLSESHRDQYSVVRSEIETFGTHLREVIEEVWPPDVDEMVMAAGPPPTPKPPKPTTTSKLWTTTLFLA